MIAISNRSYATTNFETWTQSAAITNISAGLTLGEGHDGLYAVASGGNVDQGKIWRSNNGITWLEIGQAPGAVRAVRVDERLYLTGASVFFYTENDLLNRSLSVIAGEYGAGDPISVSFSAMNNGTGGWAGAGSRSSSVCRRTFSGARTTSCWRQMTSLMTRQPWVLSQIGHSNASCRRSWLPAITTCSPRSIQAI